MTGTQLTLCELRPPTWSPRGLGIAGAYGQAQRRAKCHAYVDHGRRRCSRYGRVWHPTLSAPVCKLHAPRAGQAQADAFAEVEAAVAALGEPNLDHFRPARDRAAERWKV